MPDDVLERQIGGRVAGVDEVGRGPLAGPVVAAAVVFTRIIPRSMAGLLDDSKKLTIQQRMIAVSALRTCGFADIGIGAASVMEIERINILQASLLAMRRAVAALPSLPDHALVDGNRPPALRCPVTCVVDGDAISLSIAAASIVAKVLRDRGMARLAPRFPAYGWDTNCGYGTASHRAALMRFGPTVHHRTAFGTVRILLQQAQETDEPAAGT